MKLQPVIKFSFITGVIFTIVGAILRIVYEKNVEPFIIIGAISSFIYAISVIFVIRGSKRINRREKTMWIIAFILMNSFAGLVYLIFRHKRIEV